MVKTDWPIFEYACHEGNYERLAAEDAAKKRN